MSPFTSILVPVQTGAGTSDALGHAASLARHCGARLTLAAAVEEPAWYARLLPGSEEAARALADQAAARLEAAAAPLRDEGLPVATMTLRGRLWVEAVREVLRGGHDLLLKDAEPGAGGLFGSEDLQLFRNAPCPVWIVRPSPRGRGLRRILAAVDPLPAPDPADDALNLRAHENRVALNDTILRLAVEIARLESAELHVVHAWYVAGEELLRGETRVSREEVDAYIAATREAQRGALDELLARHPGAVEPAAVHFLKGEPADVVDDAVRTLDADLVVMGTVVRTGLPGLVIGNTAETVLRRVACSVLAAKPPGFVSPVAPPS